MAPRRAKDSPHPALRLRHTLQKHNHFVYRMALSPDGNILASPSRDETIRLWNVESGQLLRTLRQHGPVVCVAWSPDGKTLASGGGEENMRVCLWDAATGRQTRFLGEHQGRIENVAWSQDGNVLASCGGSTVALWDLNNTQVLREPEGYQYGGEGVVWSPDGTRICSVGHGGNHIVVWNVGTGKPIWEARDAPGKGLCVSWSPDGRHIASGSSDKVVRIWDPETGQKIYALEGNTADVISVSFLDDGRLLASLGKNGTVILWHTSTWAEVMRVDKISSTGSLSNFAAHPTLPLMATPGTLGREINIWELDFASLRGAATAAPTIFYVNAKAVLLGDSGVGKSGLGIRLAEKEFRLTQSTHGAQFWHFSAGELTGLPTNIQAELTLWDLAGQPEYRLTHQLFLDDTDAAILLFDCSDSNDPFRGVLYWAKVLKKNAPAHAKKYLVSARSDVSPVTVDRREINRVLAEYGLDEYFKTSAATGEGVVPLFERMMNGIPWDKLPRTSTPKLFQVVRELLLERKQADATFITMNDVRDAARQRFPERAATQAELDTVIQLLQSRGMLYRLEPRPDLTLVLLKPELVNQYGASIIQAARNHPLGIGAVTERDVLTGNLALSGFQQLSEAQEALVLQATAELMIRRGLCFREMGYLVFPSQINATRQPPTEAHPRTEVAYHFSGSIETIYASLVVRLSYTDYFHREDQWKYAVEFSRQGNRLGFSMQQVEEGTGELEIYFYPGISEFDRVTFIRFVTDHLRTKGIDIQEHIRLYCPKCSREVTNREAIEARIQDGKLDIPCQFCDTAIVIPKSVEEIYRRDPKLGEKQEELTKTVEKRTAAEVERFRSDQAQYRAEEKPGIHILHLSDLHLGDDKLAGIYRTQLETDLIRELHIARLEYLVISGDIANRATEDEYRAAFAIVDGLVKHFGLDASRVVIVPGNHDLNWDLSEAAYPFVSKRKLPSSLSEDRYIPAGDAGALLRDENLYRERFAHFNTHFYRRVYSGQDYASDYVDQTLFVERPEDRILFLGLNSCWELDHHFRSRASIHMPALTRTLDRLQGGAYDGWLKIAVWHHPVTGKEMMNDEFMQLLTVHGFQVCLHGHIHEAIEGFHKYDDRRGIRIVGAGTFGAPAREQVTGIPLQYNLLTFDPKTGEMTVQTRRKEKPNGAWSADARWGDKNDPKPWYRFNVRQYQTRS